MLHLVEWTSGSGSRQGKARTEKGGLAAHWVLGILVHLTLHYLLFFQYL